MAILEIKEVIPGSFLLRDARDWEARASTLAASDPETCDQLTRFFYRVSRQLKEIAREMRLGRMPYAQASYLITFLQEASELLHRVHENPQPLMTSIEALPHSKCHVPCQSALVRLLTTPFSSSSRGVVGHLIRWGEPLLWRLAVLDCRMRTALGRLCLNRWRRRWFRRFSVRKARKIAGEIEQIDRAAQRLLILASRLNTGRKRALHNNAMQPTNR